MDEKLVVWLHPEGSDQRQNNQMEVSEKCYPSGVHTGTSSV